MQMRNKIVSFVAAGALFLGSMAPAAFADSTISGNGSFSHNSISNRSSNRASVDQSNMSHFNNHVNVSGNTGDNRASFNTRGDSDINTGSTWASVHVSNVAGKNEANLGGACSCMQQDNSSEISGNGSFSNSRISNNTSNSLHVDQSNNTSINNSVSVRGNTGGNSSSFNTGGNSSITTGDAGADVTIHNMAGSNSLSL